MQKIVDLLQKSGVKPELVTAISEALLEYKSTIQEQFQADYNAKITEAKRLCVEESENHKRELARRVQVFLETKSAAIDAHLIRQSAFNESEAMSKLRNIKSLTEGIEVNGSSDNGKTQAAVESAQLKIKQLTEERDHAVEQANRQTELADKVLKRNRTLTTENRQLKTGTQNSGRQPTTVTEGRTQNGTRRIDGSRSAQQSVTTRPTLVESQTRQQPKPNENPVRSVGQRGNFGIDDIAATMDEEVV